MDSILRLFGHTIGFFVYAVDEMFEGDISRSEDQGIHGALFLDAHASLYLHVLAFLPVCLPACPPVSVSLRIVNATSMVQANNMRILYDPMSYWFYVAWHKVISF